MLSGMPGSQQSLKFVPQCDGVLSDMELLCLRAHAADWHLPSAKCTAWENAAVTAGNRGLQTSSLGLTSRLAFCGSVTAVGLLCAVGHTWPCVL